MFGEKPKIHTTQCDVSDFVTVEPIEIKGRQFPWDKDKIIETLKDKNVACVRTMLNYRCQAWCVFSVVDGGHLVLHRLTVRDTNSIHDVLHHLFETITVQPNGGPHCRVSLDWPEYGTDDFLFQQLLLDGWTSHGLIKNHYDAYGSLWDGIKLERLFNGG